jgi:DNA-binding MarR family transcriptional regulator/N-acetylglutamate synthase-like GNAT family acetyltransferase
MMDDKLFFGLRLKKTGELISSQIAHILSEQKIGFEARAIYILVALKENEQASIKEISEILGMTHPAIVQMVNSLSKQGLVVQNKSVDDKRITLLKLTEKGLEELEKIEPVIKTIKKTVESIRNDVDDNLMYSLSKLDKMIRNNQLIREVHSELKLNAMKEILIIPYDKKYKRDFARLNNEWLKKYFKSEKPEAKDERLLNNPEREIIKKGGEIFFAILNNIVVGTCAVIKVDGSVYELAKMGVTEKAQGKQIGKKLALTAIGYAVEKGASKLKLSTSTKLNAARNLYRSLGFKEINGKPDNRYKRKLILMELDLRV